MRSSRLAAALVLGIAAVLHAEMPPSAYESMQKRAPEVLIVELRKATHLRSQDDKVTTVSVTIEAVVLGVKRTSAGLEAGAPITIAYRTDRLEHGPPGPAPTPLLRETPSCTIFLRPSTDRTKPGTYEPAAMARSFDGCNLARW